MNRRLRPGQSGQQGFTLIEVMITLVVLCIILAVAVPNYMENVRRSTRNEARAVLMEDQLWMEQQFTVNNTYGSDATVLPFRQSPKKGTAKYKIALAQGVTATTYTLTATPETGVDTKCGVFTIDQTGKRDLSGTHSLSVDECWAGK